MKKINCDEKKCTKRGQYPLCHSNCYHFCKHYDWKKRQRNSGDIRGGDLEHNLTEDKLKEARENGM